MNRRHFLQNSVSGIVCIDPSEPAKRVAQMEKWIANGPCVGIEYRGWGNRDSIHCNHPNNYPIVEAARRMNAILYVNTWTKVGGEPRRFGGGVYGGENTPDHLVDLAKKFPDVPFVCRHGGTHENPCAHAQGYLVARCVSSGTEGRAAGRRFLAKKSPRRKTIRRYSSAKRRRILRGSS